MLVSSLESPSERLQCFSQIANSLSQDGYIILDNAFETDKVLSLFYDIKQRSSAEFHSAGIGRSETHHLNQFVRQDRIAWLNKNTPLMGFYSEWMESLRLYINRSLFLGLFDYECHYAHYPEGAFYKKHVDAFQGESNRRLTCILYLNPSWQQDDGGDLLIYSLQSDEVLEVVSPLFGRMVIFLSEEFPHEVLPTQKSRYSITGWFHINRNIGVNLDPPA